MPVLPVSPKYGNIWPTTTPMRNPIWSPSNRMPRLPNARQYEKRETMAPCIRGLCTLSGRTTRSPNGAVREKGTGCPVPGARTQPAESDAETTERTAALEGEKRGTPFLRRAAGAGRADLLFRIRDTVTAERTLTKLLADDPGDGLYPQVVWALHVLG